MLDKVDKILCRLQCLYFFELSVYSVIIIYLSPFMVKWGVTMSELAVINFAVHIVTFFSRPLFGFIADKYQNFKQLIIFIAITSSISFFLFLAVPRHVPKVLSYSLEKNLFMVNDSRIGFVGICASNISGICWPSNMSNCTFRGLSKINLTHHYNNETCAFYRFDSSNQSNYNNAILSDSMKCLNVDQNCGNHTKSHVFFEIYKKISLTWSSTFWMLGILRIIGFAVCSPLSNLTDSLIFIVLGPKRSNEYGHTRMFGTVGVFVLSFVTGGLLYLMDILTKYSSLIANIQSYSQFSLCFLLEILVYLTIIVIVSFVTHDKVVQEKRKSRNKSCIRKFMDKTSLNMVCFDSNLAIFFLFTVLAGFVETVHCEYFMVILFQKFNYVPKFLPGLLVGIMTLSESLVFGISRKMLDLCRYEFWVSFSFLVWFFRWLTYTFIKYFWQFLITEIIHGFTFGLQIASMVSYIGKRTDPSTQGRVQGLFSSLYFNIGGCSGGLFGGIILHNFDFNGLFIIMCVISFIFALVYYPLQVWIVPRCCKTSSKLIFDETKDDILIEVKEIET